MERTGGSCGRATVAGAIGGVVAVTVLVAVAVMLLGRMGPRLMSRMMSSGCSEEMRACMAKCGCGPATSVDEPAE